MANSKTRRVLPLRLILLILMGLVILYLGAGFVQQARVGHQRREELRLIEQEITLVQQQNAQLEQRLTYVQSPEAAQEWARENGWARQDEVSVVVVAPAGESLAEGRTSVEESRDPGSNREAWWGHFFGEE